MAKNQPKGDTSRTSSVVMRNAVTGRFISQGVVRHPRTTLKESSVVSMAARVTGNAQAAERWYARPNDLLGGRTPKQAVKDGDKDKVVGLLLNVAGQ